MEHNMELNYETKWFIDNTDNYTGTSYSNVEEPLVARSISREDVARFYRNQLLAEEHKSFIKMVNDFMVVDYKMANNLGILETFHKHFKISDDCIKTGMIFREYLRVGAREYYWHLIDTGGVYALEEMGFKYNKMPFTANLSEKYKQYRKSKFIVDEIERYDFIDATTVIKRGDSAVYRVELLEEVGNRNNGGYGNTIFLLDLRLTAELGLEGQATNTMAALNNNGNKFYDTENNFFY